MVQTMTPGDRPHEAALGRLAAQWTALGGQLGSDFSAAGFVEVRP